MINTPLPVWINRIGARTPVKYLNDKHLINNLRFLKRKAIKKCEEALEKIEYWGNYVPEIYYSLVEEAEIRDLDYESALNAITQSSF